MLASFQISQWPIRPRKWATVASAEPRVLGRVARLAREAVLARLRAGPTRRVRQRAEDAEAAGGGGGRERVVAREVERVGAAVLDHVPLDVEADPAGAHRGERVERAVAGRLVLELEVVGRDAEALASLRGGGRRGLRLRSGVPNGPRVPARPHRAAQRAEQLPEDLPVRGRLGV